MSNSFINIGKKPVYRGVYNVSTKYYSENMVAMCACLFQCAVPSIVGVPPITIDASGNASFANTSSWNVIIDNLALYNNISYVEEKTAILREIVDEFIVTISDDWKKNTNYVVGNYVIKGGALYKCVTDHNSGNAFDSTKWQQTTIANMVDDSLSANIATKEYVNDKVATSTANFVGTYNSLAELQAVQNPTNNDYGFVIETDAQGNEYYERYKYVAASQQWLFEYKVESTPFTATQWAAIQSGITSALVTKLNALPTAQELALGAIYDVSAHNNNATFTSLSALLSDTNLSTLIPTDVRKGGMSLKFVQSSDNKYVQYRLMAASWSINIDDWAIADESVYVENPEFVYVKTDAEDRILWAIRTDGDIFYGAGVPQQVIDYIEKKISDLSLDEYEDIVAFLSDLEKGDKTLQTLLNEKVDKEEGKSLIPTQYIQEVENPEFIEAKTDADDKLTEATRKDGTKVIYGDLEVLGSLDIQGVAYKVVSNPEWLKVIVDGNNRIICGIKTDGKFIVYIADFLDDIEAIKTRLEELDAYSVTENPEFMEVELDAKNKVLSGRKADGTKIENNDVELKGNATVGGSLEINSVVIETSEDPEGRSEVTTDSEGRIIFYRDKNGVLHENVGIKAATLTLSERGLSDFETALKSIGLLGINDASDRDNIELPEPKNYGMLNLVIPALPVTDSATSEGYAEYYDFAGNTFKIACSVEMQGQTSKAFALTGGKGNYTLDLAKDVKFGSWVPQDSFHLKGCAKDITRGILSTSYKFAYTIQEYLQASPNRVLMDENAITTTNATGDRLTDWPTDARCIPDGFPCELYINGEYWGLYAVQLKKHRKNYSMNKSDYTSFFLDADDFGMYQTNGGFWNGYIDWTKFEIKNPKDLYCMDGSKYDGDHPKELIDDTATGIYDATNKKHKGSKKTKEIIKSFSAKYLEVKALVDTNTTESLAEAKTKFAAYFDVDACIFVYIFNCMMYNTDSINKNTLWGIYSDGKIVPMLWDLDAMYGHNWIGINVVSPSSSMWGTYSTNNWPLGLLWKLYESEIKATYIDLRSHGIISIDAWKAVMRSWVNRIGPEAFERDIEKWPETPSYRKNRTNTEYWEEVSVITSGLGSYTEWNDELVSSENDIVAVNMGSSNVYMLYKYINQESSSGNCPVTSFYSSFPTVGGFYDSPKRMEKWMAAQIALCDTLIGYSQ